MHRTLLPALAALTLWLTAAPASADDDSALWHVLRGPLTRSFSAGFIRESLPLIGFVSQTTGDSQITGNRRLLGNGDTLYLTVSRPQEVSPGDLLTIYRQRHKVYHPITGQYLGYLFDVRAIARVRKIEGTTAVVFIVGGYNTISPGDGVTRFVPPPASPQESVTVVAGTGTLIDVEPPRSLIAQNDLVYLDWGRQHGLRVGSQLKVFRTSGGLPSRDIAQLRVVAIEERTATAEVVSSYAPLLRGDRFAYQSGPAATGAAGDAATMAAPAPVAVAKVPPPPPLELQREATRLTINLDDLVDQLEYESGEVTVKPAGLEILKQVHALLVSMPPHRITVEGHADNVPIGPSLRTQFASNRELSQARADFVVRYLREQGGLESASLVGVGLADAKPVASNESEEGRRRNRRIEIVLTPVEADTDDAIRLPEPPPDEAPSPAPQESVPAP